MSTEFTEENLGKSYALLEILTAQNLANQFAIRALVEQCPNAAGFLMALSENSGEMLQALAVSDRLIALVQQHLAMLATPPTKLKN